MSPCPAAALAIAAFSAGAVALGDAGQDRAVVALEQTFEGRGETRIAAGDAADLVDGGDRHRRVLEEAHEAHFRRARGSAPSSRARLSTSVREAPGLAVSAEGHLVEQAHRQRLAGAGLEIEVEHLGFDLAGRGGERGEQRCALAGDDVGELERAGADFRQIVAEPGGERGVEIDDCACGIDREKPGRGVVEIVDGVLQFLEHVFRALAVARHVGDRPHGHFRVALGCAERAHAQAQPAAAMRRAAGKPHLFLQPTALARGFEQAIDRFGDVGVADEHPLDRAHVVVVDRADQVEIGGIGVEHPARLVGDDDAVEGVVGERLEHRIAAVAAGKRHDAGGKREQREHADGAEHGQQRQDVGFRMVAPDIDDAGGGGDQQQRDQQHHADAAAARRALALVERLPPLLGTCPAALRCRSGSADFGLAESGLPDLGDAMTVVSDPVSHAARANHLRPPPECLKPAHARKSLNAANAPFLDN